MSTLLVISSLRCRAEGRADDPTHIQTHKEGFMTHNVATVDCDVGFCTRRHLRTHQMTELFRHRCKASTPPPPNKVEITELQAPTHMEGSPIPSTRGSNWHQLAFPWRECSTFYLLAANQRLLQSCDWGIWKMIFHQDCVWMNDYLVAEVTECGSSVCAAVGLLYSFISFRTGWETKTQS